MHSINFNALGVYGKTSNIAGRHSTQSEFDRNLDKHGFEIIGETADGLILWKNGEWTNYNSSQLTKKTTRNDQITKKIALMENITLLLARHIRRRNIFTQR